MDQRYLWIFVGLPASGKSFKVKELFHDRNRTDVDILSTDDIIEMKSKLRGLTYTEGFSFFIDEATEMFFSNFNASIKNNRSIVIDRTNLTKKSRSKFLSQIPKHYKKIALVVKCSDGVHSDRLNFRSEKHIPDHVIKNMKQNYQHPTYEEGFDKIIEYDTSEKEEELLVY